VEVDAVKSMDFRILRTASVYKPGVRDWVKGRF
jgi:hypothetical protein